MRGKRSTHRAIRPASRRVLVEALERRVLFDGTAFTWTGGPGDWNDPSHWSHAPPPPPEGDRSLPNGLDWVTIPASAGTVTISSNAVARKVTTAAELRIMQG